MFGRPFGGLPCRPRTSAHGGRTSANETKTETRSGVPTGPTSSRDVPPACTGMTRSEIGQCGGGVDCRGRSRASPRRVLEDGPVAGRSR
jgi:hypothetical protein